MWCRYIYYQRRNDRGIKILQVIEGGPAEDAGLKAGDIITAINGNEIDLTDFDEASSPIMGKEGTKVTVTILRDGVKKTMNLQGLLSNRNMSDIQC